MNTSEPTAPGDGEDHALAPEIDGALHKLPAQDCQLLLMRYWQQQDWRSIGKTFGMSDDTAQKRMTRALERLRRILARRGITSTAGALSSVLAGTVPRDLPAAAVTKIVSAAQADAAAHATFTILTTFAMTTKTKLTLASVLLLIMAAVPAIYQQHRISALEEELTGLKQRPLAASKIPAGPVIGNRVKPPGAIMSEDSNAPENGGKVMKRVFAGADVGFSKDGLGHGLLTNEKVKEKVAALRKRLGLTPKQEEEITKLMEAALPKVQTSPDGTVRMKLAGPEERKKLAEGIEAVLTAEQHEGYAAFRQEETANAVEAAANRELSQLQSMTTLSAEQKDAAFAALSKIALEEQSQAWPEQGTDHTAMETTMAERWNARQEAMSGILTPEQQAVYQQSGNLNRAATMKMDSAQGRK